jgi:predicted transcriptional regulator
MEDLLMKQGRLKCYDKLKQGRYTMLCKQEAAGEQELAKQLDRLRSLNAIVAKLSEEYPNLQTIIRNVEMSIQTRLNQEEEGGGFNTLLIGSGRSDKKQETPPPQTSN